MDKLIVPLSLNISANMWERLATIKEHAGWITNVGESPLTESNKKFLAKLCVIGLVGTRVTSWGYQEEQYFLTDLGKQTIIRYKNRK